MSDQEQLEQAVENGNSAEIEKLINSGIVPNKAIVDLAFEKFQLRLDNQISGGDYVGIYKILKKRYDEDEMRKNLANYKKGTSSFMGKMGTIRGGRKSKKYRKTKRRKTSKRKHKKNKYFIKT